MPRQNELTIYEEQASDVLAQAEAVKVVDETTRLIAGNFAQACKGLIDNITSFFKPMKDKAHAAHKEICDNENKHLKPVKEAMAIFRRKTTDYDMEQRRKLEEEHPDAVIKAPIAEENVSYRDNWKWRVPDISKLAPEFKKEIPDEAKINAVVKSLKGETKIEGVEVYNEPIQVRSK